MASAEEAKKSEIGTSAPVYPAYKHSDKGSGNVFQLGSQTTGKINVHSI